MSEGSGTKMDRLLAYKLSYFMLPLTG